MCSNIEVKCPNCPKSVRIDVLNKNEAWCPNCHTKLIRRNTEGLPLPPKRPEKKWEGITGYMSYVLKNFKLPPNKEHYQRRLEIYNKLQAIYQQANQLWKTLQERERQVKLDQFKRTQQQLKEEMAKKHWMEIHQKTQLSKIDRMSGLEFEEFLRILFAKMGYRVKLTPKTGDQGADLILWGPKDNKIAIQAKRYSGTVSNSAIQQLLAGMVYYDCSEGIVVTTSDYSRSAKKLAEKSPSISLWARKELAEACASYIEDCIPPFSWDKYNALVENLDYDEGLSPEFRKRIREFFG